MKWKQEGYKFTKFTCMYYFCHITLKNMTEHEVVPYLIFDIQIILDCNCVLRFSCVFKP